MTCLRFGFLCSTVVQHLKTTVTLGGYKYPDNLKGLAKQRMEDSENLSQTTRQKLAAVKWENVIN